MNYAYAAYALLTTGVFLSCYPFCWLSRRLFKHKAQMFSQRMGVYSNLKPAPRGPFPRIWIHAVSVGEVRAAYAVIEALLARLQKVDIILSISTTHGFEVACRTVSSRVTCIYAPLDFIASVRNALSLIKPSALVFMETEIWPNWIMAAHQRRVPMAIVNGRLSSRSIRAYRRIRRLMAETLNCIAAFSMIHLSDAERIIGLGAPSEKVEVNGNAKFDLPMPPHIRSVVHTFKTKYAVDKTTPVIVAGSIRGEEPRLLLDAYEKVLRRFPHTLLVMAPRHMERVADVQSMALAKGFPCQLHTEILKGTPRRAQVVVLDTMGELFAVYGIATVVFCGGSLVPLGGQNILEAAVWGKPVLYGPFMEDFLDAKRLLERYQAGTEVRNQLELTAKIIDFLSSPQQAAQKGDLAREAVASCQGAAQKHADVICRLLKRQ